MRHRGLAPDLEQGLLDIMTGACRRVRLFHVPCSALTRDAVVAASDTTHAANCNPSCEYGHTPGNENSLALRHSMREPAIVECKRSKDVHSRIC